MVSLGCPKGKVFKPIPRGTHAQNAVAVIINAQRSASKHGNSELDVVAAAAKEMEDADLAALERMHDALVVRGRSSLQRVLTPASDETHFLNRHLGLRASPLAKKNPDNYKLRVFRAAMEREKNRRGGGGPSAPSLSDLRGSELIQRPGDPSAPPM